MQYLIYSVCLLFLLACNTQKGCLRKYPPQSIVRKEIKETVKDSFVYLPADSSVLEALLACDSLGNVYLAKIANYETGKNISIPKLAIQNNHAVISCRMEPIEIKFNWKELAIRTDSIEVVQLPPVTTNEITAWQRVRMKVGELGLVVALIYLVILFRKWR